MKNIMLKNFATAVFLPLFMMSASAADWYVRPGGVGSKTGVDWNNAWDSAGIAWASVSPGDTIWLAGGTYANGIVPKMSGSAGKLISIKRVLATDATPTAAAGWNSSFDSKVVVSPSNANPIDWQSQTTGSYLLIDCRVDSGIQLRIAKVGYTWSGA